MPAQRNYVLIDYENVQPDLMPLLSETNIYVIVFVGAAQKSVPVDFAAAMQRLGSRATYIKLSGNGSNALDFTSVCWQSATMRRTFTLYRKILALTRLFSICGQNRSRCIASRT